MNGGELRGVIGIIARCEWEHLDRLRVERRHLKLARLGVRPVAAAARRHPDALAAILLRLAAQRFYIDTTVITSVGQRP